MRIFSLSAVSVFVAVLFTMPVAEARMRSTLPQIVDKYGVRQEVRSQRGGTNARKTRVTTVALPTVADGALTWGSPTAPVTIVNFVDFECPGCKTYWSTVWPELKSRYVDTGKARMVLRHYPIPSMHDYTIEASWSVVCMREQSDELARALVDELEAEPDFSVNNPLYIAMGLQGSDMQSLTTCLTREEIGTVIEADVEMARTLGVNYVPSVFVYGPGSTDPVRVDWDLRASVRTVNKFLRSAK